jgi:hypothetical protein
MYSSIADVYMNYTLTDSKAWGEDYCDICRKRMIVEDKNICIWCLDELESL